VYFARSWTGNLVFCAHGSLNGQTMVVRAVLVSSDESYLDDRCAIDVVDYLIKSHVYGLVVPHPFPPQKSNDSLEELALYSFSSYGTRGLYGSFETTRGERGSETACGDP
jgi:hypothetical protein